MSLQFQEISRGEILWVSRIILRGDSSYSVIYTPAIVKHATHKDVCVRVGNIQPFSTDWIYGYFSPQQYEENPSRFPTTMRVERELTFPVIHNKVQPIPKKYALHRRPNTCISPYERVNFKCGYGDFEPTVNGFVNRVWEIENERDFPRFTKPALRHFVQNFFIQKMDGTYMRVRYPLLFEGGVIYREEGNNFPYENPSSRESVLRFFFQRCVSYLANQNWFDLVRATGLNGLNYTESWRDLHRAFVLADQEGVDALSFVAEPSTLVFTEHITSAMNIPNNEINIFINPDTEKSVVQVRTQTMRSRLSVASISI